MFDIITHWVFLLKKYIFLNLFLTILTSFGVAANAVELETGLSGLEEGDDRYRPAINLGLRMGKKFSGRLFYTNQTFGPVKTDTVMVSGAKPLGLFNGSQLEVTLGGALLVEATAIEYKGEDTDQNVSDSQLNLGAFAGFYWTPLEFSKLSVSLGWESGLFLAGINGGILLATGRKQFLSIGLRGEL